MSKIEKEMLAIGKAIEALEELDAGQRAVALTMIAARLNVTPTIAVGTPIGNGGGTSDATQKVVPASQVPAVPTTSGPRDNAKARAFLAGKKAKNDVQQVSCLAYYLAKHEDVRTFTTKDLEELNQAAAGRVIPMADSSNNAKNRGYLAKAGKGRRQLAPKGEAVVEALPDHAAAIVAVKEHPARKGRKKKAKAKKP